MYLRRTLFAGLILGLAACSAVPIAADTPSVESPGAFQPPLPTLEPIPALVGSESGSSLLATVTASERLDYDARAHALEIELLELIGRARAQDGLTELQSAGDLKTMAALRARDMLVRDYFAHQDPETGQVFAEQWIENAGYTGEVGELIYTSTVSADLLAQETYLRWMGSSSHRAHLLNPAFRWVGINTARNGDWRVVVALFAQNRDQQRGR